MGKRTLTRRRFGLGAGTIAVAGLAGCLGDDGDDNGEDNGEGNNSDDDDENRSNKGDVDAESGALTVILENGDGDPVSSGVEVSIQGEDMSYTLNPNQFEEGEAQQGGVIFGEYDVTVSSTAEEPAFDPIEETFEMEEEEQELSYTIEGAPGDDSGNETDE